MADEEKTEVVEGKVEETKVEFSVDNMPKTKGDWDSLKEQDFTKWGELTQSNIDTLYRQNKELQDSTKTLEAQRDNLKVELDQSRVPPPPQFDLKVPESGTQPKPYSTENLPKNDKEWEDLSIDNPVLFTDLRTKFVGQQQVAEQGFESAQTVSRKSVQTEHPDMYLAELDDKGEPKKDDQGKIVLKVDPASGEPIFNPKSEKGKLWSLIYSEDVITGHDAYGNAIRSLDTIKDGPQVLMSRMNRRLKEKGEQVIDEDRNKEVDEGQVIQDSVPPPPKTEFTYKNDAEKDHVKHAIERGTYKDEAEFFATRDNTDGIYDENRTPDFSGTK